MVLKIPDGFHYEITLPVQDGSNRYSLLRTNAEGTQEEISHIANGLVYEVSKDDVLSEDYIEKEREADGEMHFRILTRRQLPDNLLQKPNVEDGYLCVLKEI